jgi:hypothetical protein
VAFEPNPAQIAQLMSQATAPAFILGAVAGFTAVLLNRMSVVVDRIRSLNEIGADDTARAHLKTDIPRLLQRYKLLSSATYFALASGVSTSLLLVVGFACAFLQLQHEYGAGSLFILSLTLLAVALFRFGQEVSMGLSTLDHYR